MSTCFNSFPIMLPPLCYPEYKKPTPLHLLPKLLRSFIQSHIHLFIHAPILSVTEEGVKDKVNKTGSYPSKSSQTREEITATNKYMKHLNNDGEKCEKGSLRSLN